MKPKIKYVNYGLANTFEKKNKKWIEINKNLKRYPKLYKNILEHELKHYYSKNKHIDFMIEIKDMLNFKKQAGITKFMKENPRAYFQLLPFVWDKKGFFPDWFMLGFYGVLFILFMVLFKFLTNILS